MNRKLINIVTAASRIPNLNRLGESIRIAKKKSKLQALWFVVVDGLRAPMDMHQLKPLQASLEKPLIIVCHKDPESVVGGGQKNRALQIIQDGFICFLDDENLMHPDYLIGMETAIKKNPSKWTFICGQRRLDSIKNLPSGPGCIRQNNIDTAQFLVHKSRVGNIRWEKVRHNDFCFINAVLRSHPGEFFFIPDFLCYYNYLNHPEKEWLKAEEKI